MLPEALGERETFAVIAGGGLEVPHVVLEGGEVDVRPREVARAALERQGEACLRGLAAAFQVAAVDLRHGNVVQRLDLRIAVAVCAGDLECFSRERQRLVGPARDCPTYGDGRDHATALRRRPRVGDELERTIEKRRIGLAGVPQRPVEKSHRQSGKVVPPRCEEELARLLEWLRASLDALRPE